MTRIRRPSGWKSSKNTVAHTSAPGGLWAPSMIVSGCTPSTSKRPGISTLANPSLTNSSSNGAAKKASTAASAHAGVVALVRAVERHEHVGVHGGHGAQIDRSPADRERVVGGLEVLTAHEVGGTTLGDEDVDQIRIGLAHHDGAPRLDDAGLLAGDVGEGRAGELGVVESDVGDHRHLCVDDVGGVPSAEHADLDHRDIDRDVGEPAERGRSDSLEVGGADPGDRLEVGDAGDLLGEVVVADRFTVALDPFVDAFEVRAGVGADRRARVRSATG